MGSLSITGTLKVASWEVIFGKDGERKAGRGVVNWGMVDYYSGELCVGWTTAANPIIIYIIRLSRPWWVARA